MLEHKALLRCLTLLVDFLCLLVLLEGMERRALPRVALGPAGVELDALLGVGQGTVRVLLRQVGRRTVAEVHMLRRVQLDRLPTDATESAQFASGINIRRTVQPIWLKYGHGSGGQPPHLRVGIDGGIVVARLQGLIPCRLELQACKHRGRDGSDRHV